MSRFSKTDVRGQFTVVKLGSPALSSEDIEIRRQMLADFSRYIVGFREGKQSSCRGAWSSKEYSEVRLMLRQVPKAKAFDM